MDTSKCMRMPGSSDRKRAHLFIICFEILFNTPFATSTRPALPLIIDKMTSTDPSFIFVYGSLQVEAVLKIVLGRVPSMEPAILPNHRRVRLHNRCYPAVIPQPLHSVSGFILQDFTPTDLATLDAFEDSAYERRVCPVQLSNPERVIQARVWVRLPHHEKTDELMDGDVVLDGPDWSLEEFEREDKERYLEACSAWATSYLTSFQ